MEPEQQIAVLLLAGIMSNALILTCKRSEKQIDGGLFRV